MRPSLVHLEAQWGHSKVRGHVLCFIFFEKLILVLDNTKDKVDEVIDPDIISPILQIDGSLEADKTEQYTFTSSYAEEDIIYTLDGRSF